LTKHAEPPFLNLGRGVGQKILSRLDTSREVLLEPSDKIARSLELEWTAVE
jgi:hypothetical protein